MGFEQALSGLNASSKQLDTIGNNVANAATVGFKQSQAQFADMFAVSMSGGGVQIGTGVQLAAVAQQFTQGNITNTNNPMDTAISGQGFFRMVDQNGAIKYSRNGQFHVDKDGFLVNNQGHNVTGYLPNAAGTIITANPSPLIISAADMDPHQTASAAVGANLNSLAAVPITAAFDPLDPASYNNSTSVSIYDSLGGAHVGTLYFQRLPIATVGNGSLPAASNTMTVGSTAGLSVGNTVTLSGVTYTITAVLNGTSLTVTPASVAAVPAAPATTNAPSSNWNTYLAVDGAPVGGTPTAATAVTAPGATTIPVASTAGLAVGDVITIAGAGAGGVPLTTTITAIAPGVAPAGTLTFNTPTVTATAAAAAVTPQKLATLTFDSLGNLIAPAGPPLGQATSSALFPTSTTVNAAQTVAFNFSQSTQFGADFGVNSLSQDGFASGRLNGFSTSSNGIILGRYSNGQSRNMGQVLLTNFTNPRGLQPVGNNEWVETFESGGPLVGVPGTASLGLLQSSATEDSNVDLTAELVNMITAQRNYQANAQTIKAQDTIMQTVVNLR